MALYSIADFIIDIRNKYNFLETQCSDYIFGGNALPDFIIEVTDEQIQNERDISEPDNFSDGYLESICAYRQLCLSLPQKDALLLHASVISYNGKGIAFLARSGVGKTTHTSLWKSVYGNKVEIINGDKPIVRFFENRPFAYGTPWAGKENYQINKRVELTDICFIERSNENTVTKISINDCLGSLMMQLLHPSDQFAALKTLEMVDKLAKHCNFWKIRCNTSNQAAIIAHDRILGDLEK